MNNGKKKRYSWYYNSGKKSFVLSLDFSCSESDVNYFNFSDLSSRLGKKYLLIGNVNSLNGNMHMKTPE